jgi:hypothetical protein
MKNWHAELDCGFEEIAYGRTIRRDKGNVALSKTLTGLAWANPEFRIRIATETNDLLKVHDTVPSHSGKDDVIEGGTRLNIGTLH